MGWFGGRVQRTSSKIAVVFANLAVLGILVRLGGAFSGGSLVRESVVLGASLSVIGVIGMVASLIVTAMLDSSPAPPAPSRTPPRSDT